MKTNCGSSPDSITKVTMNEQPKSQDPRTICPLNDVELLQACHKAITDMCQKQRWQMTVPPDMSRDSDMLLSELCTRFSRVSGEPPKPDKTSFDNAVYLKGYYTQKQLLSFIDTVSGEAKTEEQLEKLFKIKFVANMHVKDFEAFKRTYLTLWYKVILPTLKQIANVE